jgi:hypothetical protein
LLILSVSVVASGISVADRISAFAQTNETRQDNSNNTNATNINQINQTLTKKIRVGDIDVGYKMFGKGDRSSLLWDSKGQWTMGSAIFTKPGFPIQGCNIRQ